MAMELRDLANRMPPEAAPAMAAGQIWNVPEPPRPPTFLERGEEPSIQRPFRVAEFKLALFHDREILVGRWRGETDWIPMQSGV